MGTRSKAPDWQRAISAVLAIAGIWALARPELYDNLERPGNLFVLAFGLSGIYLFGHFAIRGRLPTALALSAPREADHEGDA